MAVYYDKGTYNVECLECALQTSSNGDPMIALKVRVLASVAEDGSFVTEQEQREQRIYMTIKNEEESLIDIAERLRGAGWNGTKFENLPTEMVGLQFAADCWHAINKGKNPKYAGQMEEKWALWSPNRREPKPLENNPSVAKDLNNLLGKVLKNTPVVQKPKNQEQSRNHTGRGDDAGPPPRDEIPF